MVSGTDFRKLTILLKNHSRKHKFWRAGPQMITGNIPARTLQTEGYKLREVKLNQPPISTFKKAENQWFDV